MHGMQGVWDVECLECRVFRARHVWDLGCLRCGIFGTWDVLGERSPDPECRMSGMWDV